MAPRTDPVAARPVNNDIDNYDVDDDPFAESGDEAPANNAQSKKRKDTTGLGIDEAVAVQKKVRAPIVKLDEGRFVLSNLVKSDNICSRSLDYYLRKAYRDYGEKRVI